MLTSRDKQGIWLIAAVVAVLIGLLTLKAVLDNKPKPGADNCVGAVTRNTVIVLDHTEKINHQTLEEIASRAIAHVTEHVKVNERVSVFTVSDLSKKSLKPVLSLCRPPDDGNRAVEDVQGIRKRFQQNFAKPLRETLTTSPGDSLESPIAQALTDISLSQYLRGNQNSLLVFSDMLENTKGFSLYKCSSPADVIVRYRQSRRGAMERPEFVNTSIVLNLIPRLNQTATSIKCRDLLWSWFFGNNSGAQAGFKFDYLPGGAPMDAPSKAKQ